MIPHMMQYNWLVSYASIEGIARTLTQMDSRTKNKSNMRFADKELIEFYTQYEEDFTLFFDEIQTFVRDKILDMNMPDKQNSL